MGDASDILGIARPRAPAGPFAAPASHPKRSPEPGSEKKERKGTPGAPGGAAGINRELLALTGGIPPIFASPLAATAAAKNKQVTWRWQRIDSSVRLDSLPVNHWEKYVGGKKQAGDYAFAKFNKAPVILEYTDEEYAQLLSSTAWSRQETDYLMDMCRQFGLRFVVICDRYTSAKGPWLALRTRTTQAQPGGASAQQPQASTPALGNVAADSALGRAADSMAPGVPLDTAPRATPDGMKAERPLADSQGAPAAAGGDRTRLGEQVPIGSMEDASGVPGATGRAETGAAGASEPSPSTGTGREAGTAVTVKTEPLSVGASGGPPGFSSEASAAGEAQGGAPEAPGTERGASLAWPERSVEDLKVRFFEVVQRLAAHRSAAPKWGLPQMPGGAPGSLHQPQLGAGRQAQGQALPPGLVLPREGLFNVDKEQERKRALAWALSRTRQQVAEEDAVLAEADRILKARGQAMPAPSEGRRVPLSGAAAASHERKRRGAANAARRAIAAAAVPEGVPGAPSVSASLAEAGGGVVGVPAPGTPARAPRVYVRGTRLAATLQAANNTAGTRLTRRIEQTLEELGVPLRPQMPTRAVCTEYVALRKEVVALLNLQKKVQWKAHEVSLLKDGHSAAASAEAASAGALAAEAEGRAEQAQEAAAGAEAAAMDVDEPDKES